MKRHKWFSQINALRLIAITFRIIIASAICFQAVFQGLIQRYKVLKTFQIIGKIFDHSQFFQY